MPKKVSTLEYITPEQVEVVAKACKRKEDTMLVRFLYDTGCRVSEALVVKVGNINYSDHNVELPALKRKDSVTKFATISDGLAQRLREYCKGRGSNWKLFRISRQLAYIRIRLAARKAGIEGVYPHLLRDSLATDWAKRGGSLTVLQRQLGHKKLSTTTDRYIKYQTSDIYDERKRIGI